MKKDRILLLGTASVLPKSTGMHTEQISNSLELISILKELYKLGKRAREDYDVIMIADFSSILKWFGLACTITCLRMLYELREKFGYKVVVLPHYEDIRYCDLED